MSQIDRQQHQVRCERRSRLGNETNDSITDSPNETLGNRILEKRPTEIKETNSGIILALDSDSTVYWLVLFFAGANTIPDEVGTVYRH